MEDERAEPAYVVGIGASAGGLEALEQLFAEMPPATGLAFVVVQHLSPDFRSVMDELLARRTSIPVTLVEDGVAVEPDHIYLIPPKKEMIISGGRLLLSDKGTTAELVLPIDIFFRSLAQDAGARGIAIVLSGGGSDGSRGIRDVHEAGGLVICQDELSAAFDGMPRSARDTGIVDQVLAPREMPRAILAHVRKPREIAESAAAPRGIHAIYRLLQQSFGIDFSHYKPTTVLRRIDRRLHMGPSIDVDAYVDQLARDPAELDALYRDLLIGVTRFFRDEEAFELLERSVIPELLDRVKGEEVRVWVPGCATGEEAYSLAILFHEALTERNDKRRLKVFATDVHPGSLEIAARGLYDADSIARVTPARLGRYFERLGRSAQVSAELRQLIVFARHNVTRDAPFTRVDLLSCRNLLIYLQPLAQKKVLGLFHFALKNQGVLFLGPSETPGAFVDDFEPINPHWRLY
ncbi:MAG: histidine kinase, partial [Myxococcales bacterium]|nr:histidine kinase [Myxococcales bacterium]